MAQPKLPKRLGLTVALVTFASMVLILVALMFSDTRGLPASKPNGAASTATDSRGTSTPNADAFASGTGAYMDDREKQLYERDPTSRGYTEADRDFLREHGMTEDEARAAETVLHEQGVDD